MKINRKTGRLVQYRPYACVDYRETEKVKLEQNQIIITLRLFPFVR